MTRTVFDENVSRLLKISRAAHAVLITGPSDADNLWLAQSFARALLCSNGEFSDDCECPDCKKMQNNTHPDFKMLSANGKKSVSVDSAREFKDDIYYLPNEGAARVYLISRAQDMTVQAQNSLLKMLEEPPGYVKFILTAPEKGSLLATVVSRAVCFDNPPLEESELAARLLKSLPDLTRENALSLVRLSGGYYRRALEINGDSPVFLMKNALIELLILACEKGRQPFFDAAKEILNTHKNNLDELFSVFLTVLRDIAVFCRQKRGENLYFFGDALKIERLSTRIKDENISKMINISYDIKNMLRLNVNFNLLSWFFMSGVWEAMN